MADEADLAMEYQTRHNAAALAAALGRRRELPREIGGVRVCVDCGDPIVAARLRAAPHAVRCVACEADRERRPA